MPTHTARCSINVVIKADLFPKLFEPCFDLTTKKQIDDYT